MNFRSGSERTRPPGTSGFGASRVPLRVGVGFARPAPPRPALPTESREGGLATHAPLVPGPHVRPVARENPASAAALPPAGRGRRGTGRRPGPARGRRGRLKAAPGARPRRVGNRAPIGAGKLCTGGAGCGSGAAGGSVEIAGAAGGGAARPPGAPGPAPGSAPRTRGQGGDGAEGPRIEGPEGGSGSLTASPGAVGLHVPPSSR